MRRWPGTFSGVAGRSASQSAPECHPQGGREPSGRTLSGNTMDTLLKWERSHVTMTVTVPAKGRAC
ncbi:hypothetical protein Axi01nite_33370 [Actinoplanes xinjiangensis]|nr:hypothetical protein Axi01nite_33370 [Actinoplanes xinjiangensis]